MREAKIHVSQSVSLKLYDFERFDDASGYRMKVGFISDPCTDSIVGIGLNHQAAIAGVSIYPSHCIEKVSSPINNTAI